MTKQISKALGFIVPHIVAMLIISLSKLWMGHDGITNSNDVLIFSEFVIVPFLIGTISAWFWRDIRLKRLKMTLWSIWNTFIAIGASYFFLKEGTICLIIVSPLLGAFIVLGAFTGKAMFQRNNQKLNVSMFAALLAIFVFDSLSTHRFENMVADTIVIKAPPTRVWKYVVAYKRIEKKDKFWLFQAGMPSPVQSTAGGNYVGAWRKCIFSNGYVFDEKIVTYEKEKDLTFEITDQPRDPEIMGHIDILKGQFLLKDNGDGTTTLTGNSWYRLYVFPSWYYDMWAKSITRNVHLRVMEHIKELSESR